MGTMAQKKFSISIQQREFLENCKEWGFSDQSSFVREAIERFIKELKTKRQKDQMEQKARELLNEYSEDKDLTVFTDLDTEDFL
jgi:Arc/MetJ-type ribon-helix-helix transcriptional regulator